MPTIQELVAASLRAQGYDGLFNPGDECACILNDLMPCDEPSINCVAGFRGPPRDDDFDFGVYESREEAEKANEENARN